MSWTDERIELLKKLWLEGLSASQIAGQIGGVSRNAVIGKVHRLKLSSRSRATATPARQKKTVKSAGPARPGNRSLAPQRLGMTVGAAALRLDPLSDAVAQPVARPLVEIVAPPARKLKLTELTERTCKWPIGDPVMEEFHFCGNDTAETGPYCGYHARIAYQPVSDRKRLR